MCPEPVQSLLTMELAEASLALVDVRVVNTSGQQFMTKKAVKVSKGSITTELSHLPAGLYQIIATSENNTYNKSVSK